MKVYKLCTFYNDFTKKNYYFVGETELETAKKYLIMAKKNENIHAADIHSCCIDFEGRLISDKLIEEFIRK